MDKPDFESTTAILARRAPGLRWLLPFKNYLTPAAVGSAVASLAVAIWYVVAATHELHSAQTDISNLQKQAELLNDIKTQIAVVNSKVDTIANEVSRQREWREKIESAAEAPPHARRR